MRSGVSRKTKNERERFELKKNGFTDHDITMLFALRDNRWSDAIRLTVFSKTDTVAITLTHLLLPKLIELLEQLRKMQSFPNSRQKSETAADVRILSEVVLSFCCLKKNNPGVQAVSHVIGELNKLNAPGLSKRILDKAKDNAALLGLFGKKRPGDEKKSQELNTSQLRK